jgi:hypothetical protein
VYRVHCFSEQEVQALAQPHRNNNDADVRSRCDMIIAANTTIFSCEPVGGKASRSTKSD